MKRQRDTWRKVVITEVATMTDCVNRTAPVVNFVTPFKMIRTTNIRNGRVDTLNVRYVTEEVFTRWTRRGCPIKGDVLLTREAPLGEVGIVRRNDTIFLGQRIVQYRANPALLNHLFLFYCLQGDELQGQIKSYGSGSTVEHMRLPDCQSLQLVIPQLSTQRKIAAILSAYDDLIENNTRRIAILEAMAQAIYREWFVEFRFPGHENVKLVDSALRKIPEGWKVEPLGQVSTNLDRVRVPLSALQRSTRQGVFPYYGASGVIDHVDDFLFEGPHLLVAEDGENINSRKLPIAFLAYDKFWVNNHAHILKGNAPISNEFLLISLLNTEFRQYVTGAAQPKITQANLNRIPIIIADNQLHLRFNKVVVPLFDHRQVLIKKNANLRKTRDLLLPKLISGEVDVEDLDIDTGDAVTE